MENPNAARMNNSGAYGTVFELVIPYLTDSRDRDAVSLACRRGYEIDAITRKQVTIALCYTSTPARLSRRFPNLESLKLKGKPRAAMFNLIPEDWGGYVTPWVEEIAESFPQMKSLHFRRMIVRDSDLELLATRRGRVLEVLKLDKCSGFSTDGLLHITRSCRNLKTLFLEENTIIENDGEWLHEIALNHMGLEHLNFYMTELARVRFQDLELIARRCPLVSLKISDCDVLDLIGFFRAAVALEEFAGGSFNVQPELVGDGELNEQLGRYSAVKFPQRLCQLGLTYLGNGEMPIVFPIAARLRKLDLLYALLDTEGHCVLLQRCPNLEILETRNVIGDRGLEVLAHSCKRLKRLRIERGADEQEMEDEEGIVSHTGLIVFAQGCTELEYLAVYVSDITNEALIESLVKSGALFSEGMVAKIAYQVVQGLEYLHAHKIIHRDLKPSNLLVNGQMQVKIADFGVSKIMCRTLDPCNSYVGTCAYMSPERFDPDTYGNDGTYNGYASDIWSLGLTLLELFMGHFPYLPEGQRPDWATLMCAICFGEPPSLPEYASKEFRSFIDCCLQKDSSKRWTASQLLSHPFLHNIKG